MLLAEPRPRGTIRAAASNCCRGASDGATQREASDENRWESRASLFTVLFVFYIKIVGQVSSKLSGGIQKENVMFWCKQTYRGSSTFRRLLRFLQEIVYNCDENHMFTVFVCVRFLGCWDSAGRFYFSDFRALGMSPHLDQIFCLVVAVKFFRDFRDWWEFRLFTEKLFGLEQQ